jgi:hypothetical protein
LKYIWSWLSGVHSLVTTIVSVRSFRFFINIQALCICVRLLV